MRTHEISEAEPLRLCLFLFVNDGNQTQPILIETFEVGSGFELAGLICYGLAAWRLYVFASALLKCFRPSFPRLAGHRTEATGVE
jgi:hypothetical protein